MQSEYLEELTTNQTEAISGGIRLTFGRVRYECQRRFTRGSDWRVTWQEIGGQGRYSYFCNRITPLPPPTFRRGVSPSVRPEG
jgi:hypothetical protein